MSEQIKKRVRRIDVGGAAGVTVVGVLAVLLGVLPLHHQSQLNVARAETLQKQLADFDGLEKTMARAKVKLDETQKRLALAESRLPSEGEMAQFMQQLAQVADTAGLQVDSITPRTVHEVSGYKAMPVEIAGSGDFSSCYKFLQGLRHMNRLTRLDDLVLRSTTLERSAEPTKGQCSVHVMISTFMAR